MSEAEKITLYHGSYCEVSAPDLNKCAKYKDFGRGFYLTTSFEQAERFSLLSLKKALSNNLIEEDPGYGTVSVFCCKVSCFKKIKVHEFEGADSAWLKCVAAHRKYMEFSDIVREYEKYDVISGKIANDATNAVITAYMAGAYGEAESENAVNICISLLLPERLKDQYCFRSEKAISCLEFLESKKIWS